LWACGSKAWKQTRQQFLHLSWTADNIKRNEIEKKKNVTEIWVALNNITSGT
jgi:hypothetical protein